MTHHNILMIASSSGVGLTYHLTRLSIGLKRRGHNVMVLSGPKEQIVGLSESLKIEGINYYKSYNIDKKAVHSVLRAKKDIERLLKFNDVNVIHTQGVTHALPAYLAIRSMPFSKKPSIVTSVHSIPTDTLLQKPNWTMMSIVLNKCSDLVLPVSDNTRERLIKHGIASEKTFTVYNAIDLDIFDGSTRIVSTSYNAFNDKVPIIACVGNLIPRKGQEYYLKAAAEVLKEYSAKFYVVGSGPLRSHLEKLARDLAIDKYVVFTGRIPWSEMYYFLSNVTNICVSASLGELFPFYILECMAAGKPIITTNVGGIPEAVIEGVNGYIVPPKDPTSLRNAIVKLMNDPASVLEMGIKSRNLVEKNFSMGVITSQLEVLYNLAQKKN